MYTPRNSIRSNKSTQTPQQTNKPPPLTRQNAYREDEPKLLKSKL